MPERIGGHGGIEVEAVSIAPAGVGMDSRVARFLKVPFAPATTNEELTGFKLPANVIVLPEGIFVDVTTGAGTLEFGTAEGVGAGTGDLDGFIDGLDVSSAGQKVPVLANGAETLGALLKEVVAGGTAKTRKPFAVGATALELTVKASNAAVRGSVFIPVIDAF